ncbi:MAG: 50S ribosomal protein L4 [Nitrospinota bacterium]|nr:50S ribosomal protein L4 [Nitrospinota bacterium]
MAKIEMFNLKNLSKDEVEFSDSLFDGEVRLHLVHQVIKSQLANRRLGTHSTLTRSEVRGTGAKPWKQKGGGRARAGDVKSPIWRHGGITFGPKPRKYTQKINKKVAVKALKSVLNLKFSEKKLRLVDQLNLESSKTSDFLNILSEMDVFGKVLFVYESHNENFELSLRNLKKINKISVRGINPYDVIKHDFLVLDKDALDKLQQRLAG